tara:strand:- start:6336 stop:6992 length:657 start_codon:yes stop_codon:yes gene_type:complete
MSDFNIARKNMIHNQLKSNNILDENILKTFDAVPREIFLPIEQRSKAYLDEDVEITSDRFLLEPRIIGNIIKLSKINKNHTVLDLVCSTGYSSAILSKLSKKVFGIDNKKKLIEQATINIKKLKIDNIKFYNTNLTSGLKGKFDIIFIFGGVQYIPSNLFDFLKNDGGTLLTVLYNDNEIGKIHIIKKLNGKISRTNDITAQTPILREFQKTKKEFIL